MTRSPSYTTLTDATLLIAAVAVALTIAGQLLVGHADLRLFRAPAPAVFWWSSVGREHVRMLPARSTVAARCRYQDDMNGSDAQAGMYRRPLGRLLVEMGALSAEQLEHILAIQRHDGGRLGEIVVGRSLISPLALVTALAQQKKGVRTTRRGPSEKDPSWKPLGRLLIERNRISEIQLQQALADQREDGGFLGEILFERGWITAAELVAALNEQLRPSDWASSEYSVREHVSDEIRTLHVASSFIAASDYVFEQVLAEREPERLEILRGKEPWQEVVWSFECEQRRTPSVQDLLEAFHRFTSEWAVAS
jgi:hypothetical protein